MIKCIPLVLAAASLMSAATAAPVLAKAKKKPAPHGQGQGIMADTTGQGCGYRMVPGFAGGWIKVKNTNCQF